VQGFGESPARSKSLQRGRCDPRRFKKQNVWSEYNICPLANGQEAPVPDAPCMLDLFFLLGGGGATGGASACAKALPESATNRAARIISLMRC